MEAISPSYLKFTIYQSPKAVGFIRRRVEASAAAGAPEYFILREGRELVGFYNALRRGTESFLNYIAIAPGVQGSGFGGRLMDHFEFSAAAAGCRTTGLDVFRSNAVATAWYAKRGYKECSVRYRLRFALETLASPGAGYLEVNQVLLEQALEEEASRGFSTLPCSLGGTAVKLGLIGGSVCNILEPRSAEAMPVARAVACTFAGRRRWLLAVSAVPLLEAAQAESLEEALYMTRSVPLPAEARGEKPP